MLKRFCIYLKEDKKNQRCRTQIDSICYRPITTVWPHNAWFCSRPNVLHTVYFYIFVHTRTLQTAEKTIFFLDFFSFTSSKSGPYLFSGYSTWEKSRRKKITQKILKELAEKLNPKEGSQHQSRNSKQPSHYNTKEKQRCEEEQNRIVELQHLKNYSSKWEQNFKWAPSPRQPPLVTT